MNWVDQVERLPWWVIFIAVFATCGVVDCSRELVQVLGKQRGEEASRSCLERVIRAEQRCDGGAP